MLGQKPKTVMIQVLRASRTPQEQIDAAMRFHCEKCGDVMPALRALVREGSDASAKATEKATEKADAAHGEAVRAGQAAGFAVERAEQASETAADALRSAAETAAEFQRRSAKIDAELTALDEARQRAEEGLWQELSTVHAKADRAQASADEAMAGASPKR